MCVDPEPYRSVLLLVRGAHALARQFPPFAHWYKSGAESERDHGAQEEATSIEPDDDIDFLVWRGRYDIGHEVINEMRDEGLEGQRATENWQDITKRYTLERSKR